MIGGIQSENLTSGWSWVDEITVPTVTNNGYAAVKTVDDYENVDYSALGNGFTYDETAHTLTYTVEVTVNKSTTTPNMPKAAMSVSYIQKAVGDVELPEGWVWSDADSTKELTVGVAVEATAIYNGADKGNYVTESVKILITCQACTHTWNGGVVTKEATATEKGKKTYTCSVCKATKAEEIPALGAPEVGTEIASEDGSATYRVTEAGENGNAVNYEAPTDKNATSVVIPANVTIDNITYNVTTISDTAFAGNKKLTSVTIGDNVTGFSDKTFKGCSNLKTLIIGNGVTSIPANAFKKFKKLTTVKMGSGVKTIGKNAFYGCKALKTITIGKNVTKIGSKAFYGCSKVKTLTIKSSKLTTKKIGSKAFTKTPKSMTVKVPKKKLKAYKSMLIKRGVNKKAKFKKN